MRRALLEAGGIFVVVATVVLVAGLLFGGMRPSSMLVLVFVMPATHYFLTLTFGPLTGKSRRQRGTG